MKQIEFLWELQQHEHKFNSIKKKLEDLARKGHINNIIIELKGIESSLKEKKITIFENEKRINKSNNQLKELTFNQDEIEKNLYNGTITDLKQLHYMDMESKRIREEINKLETDTLEMMEAIEEFKQDIKNMEDQYASVKKDFEEKVKEYNAATDQLRKEAKEEMDIIYNITSKIEKNIYDQYALIKKNKRYAVAKVSKNECSGCHMIIPFYILEELKGEINIVCCENCGRILYYNGINEDI
ncbi:zinc ribbon domain-containing protein [Acidilutibacter cellobiosedens]|jgi:predicted  nucleic acid-binding Zn-ribbon protein|nr:C4-type zinc ribbon domain-containing protein [Acidilutibacter cellobiosedens]